MDCQDLDSKQIPGLPKQQIFQCDYIDGLDQKHYSNSNEMPTGETLQIRLSACLVGAAGMFAWL